MEKELIVNLKKGNKEPIKDRIQKLENQGLNNDSAVIIALGERDENEIRGGVE